jgi:hypothetical protein
MPERTALASIEWARTRAVVRDLVCPADDDVREAVMRVVCWPTSTATCRRWRRSCARWKRRQWTRSC